jgi:hypothetical protein
VAAKDRERKKRGGSIGCGVCRSHTPNAMSSATPPAIAARIGVLPQPSAFARTIPNVSPSSPPPASTRPGRSRRSFGPRDSVSRRNASGSRARPIGTFSQKIQCQEMPSTTAPPTSGPIATPSPLTPAQTPSAAPRRFAGTASLSRVRVSGVTIAAPNPWTARAAMSASMLGASADAALASVKIDSPATNIRLRPNRSPRAAPVSRKTANASV